MSIARCISTAIVVAAAGAAPAAAQPSAPRPEEASGIVVERAPKPRRTLLRAALFVPRVTIAAVLAPVRLGYWTEDRYHPLARLDALLWNDARTIGAFPTASWDGARALTAGAELVDRELGSAELTLRASAGTVERVVLEPRLSTRALRGSLRLEVGARYRDVVAASFYGYGNGDERLAPPMTLVDPLTSEVAVDSRFHMTESLVRASARWRATRWMAIKAGTSLRWLDFGAPTSMFGPDGVGLAEAYLATRVPGYVGGVEALRGELALHLEHLRVRDRTQSRATPSVGAAGEVYAGWHESLGGNEPGFVYGGVDVIGLLDVYGHDRVASLRVFVDTVAGDLAQIPFVSLPALGGDSLRGYPSNRFRDRWTAAVSAEYTWPVTEGVGAFLFVDAGRAARRAADLADDPIRASTGLGLQLFSQRSLTARMWLAASREGAIVASFRLEPSFASRPREVPR
jgi:hypothetical protein